MSFEFHWKSAAVVAGVIAVGLGVLYIGHKRGANSVLDSAILAAENEVLYRIVTVQSEAPTTELMNAANEVCEDEANRDDCMMDFLDRYGDVWVVNLIEGDRTLLTPENTE